MRSRFHWGMIVLVVALMGLSAITGHQWRLLSESRAQSAPNDPTPPAAEPSVQESVEAMRTSIAALKDQLQLLESQLQALEKRVAANASTGWRTSQQEFVAVYRPQGDARGFPRGGASLAKFTLDGVHVDSLRPIDDEVHHVAVDPIDGKVYGVGSHRIVEINPESMELTELPITASLPEMSWPCGMTFDSARRRVVVASLGGEGYLYAFDTAKRTWSLIASLDNVDLAGLAYSPQDDRYLGLEVGYEGGVRLHTFTPTGARIKTRDLGGAVQPGTLGQHDCQFVVVGRQGVIIASSYYSGALGRAVVHDPQVIAFDLEDAPRAARAAAANQPAGTFTPIDLGTAANQPMDQAFQLPHMTGNHLGDFPRGEQTLDGVTFRIGDKCIQLAGALLPDKPNSAGPIPVGSFAQRLHFLHATGWAALSENSR